MSTLLQRTSVPNVHIDSIAEIRRIKSLSNYSKYADIPHSERIKISRIIADIIRKRQPNHPFVSILEVWSGPDVNNYDGTTDLLYRLLNGYHYGMAAKQDTKDKLEREKKERTEQLLSSIVGEPVELTPGCKEALEYANGILVRNILICSINHHVYVYVVLMTSYPLLILYYRLQEITRTIHTLISSKLSASTCNRRNQAYLRCWGWTHTTKIPSMTSVETTRSYVI